MNAQRFFMLFACLALAAGRVHAQSFDEVQKKIRAAWDKVGALGADVGIEGNIPAGANRMKVSGTGKLEYLKDGETGKYRQELKLSLAENVEVTTGYIFDGKNMYYLNTVAGKTSVSKETDNKDPLNPPPGGGPLLDALQELVTFKAEPNRHIDGKEVYMLVGTAKKDAPPDAAYERVEVQVDPETGVLRQIAFFEKRDTLTLTMRYDKVDPAAKIEASRFNEPKADGAPAKPEAKAGAPDAAPGAPTPEEKKPAEPKAEPAAAPAAPAGK